MSSRWVCAAWALSAALAGCRAAPDAPSMMSAAVVEKHGGSEVLVSKRVPVPEPAAGEARIRMAAAGVNFIDIYFRTGSYPSVPPYIPCIEGAGIVDAAPAELQEWVGKRVAFVHKGAGACAEFAVVPVEKLVVVPAQVSLEQAAAAMLQGMTAHYLVMDAAPGLMQGDTILVHAAAGGTGRLVTQVGKLQGFQVFGTVSTEAKARVARDAGADNVFVGDSDGYVAEVLRLTGGAGVAAVFDSVGKTTFLHSLDCVRRRGTMVLFGASSGAPEPLDPSRLARGSLFLTRPTLFDYIAEEEELQARAAAVLDWVNSGALQLQIQRLGLSQAGEAQRLLESRATTGKLLLVMNASAQEHEHTDL